VSAPVAPKVWWATAGGAIVPAVGTLLTLISTGGIPGLPTWVATGATVVLGGAGAFIPGYTARHQNRAGILRPPGHPAGTDLP
jgi:hypothetical protein